MQLEAAKWSGIELLLHKIGEILGLVMHDFMNLSFFCSLSNPRTSQVGEEQKRKEGLTSKPIPRKMNLVPPLRKERAHRGRNGIRTTCGI